MKSLWVASILALAFVLATPSFADTRKEMTAVQAERAKAYLQKDIKLLMQRYAEDFVGKTTTGSTQNRRDVERDLRSFLSTVESFNSVKIDIQKLQKSGNHTNLIVRHRFSANFNEVNNQKELVKVTKPIVLTSRQVWMRSNGRWMLKQAQVLSQTS